MCHRDLLGGGRLDALADRDEVAHLRGLDPEAERPGVHQGVDHAAVGDVHAYRAEARHLHRPVEVEHEGGHVAEGARSHRPSRQAATTRTRPPGVSSVTTVSGSRIESMPASSSTVTLAMVFEPDIGT